MANGDQSEQTTAGPDFLLLGAMKSGTTTLFHHICSHPQVVPPERKELHFYDRHRYRGRTLDDYRAMFPRTPADMITGEATPFYLRHDHLPRWLAEDFPDVKLLAILRNPVDRAYSHFNQRAVRGIEEGELLATLKAEDRLSAPIWERARAEPEWEIDFAVGGTYLSRGRYAEQIQNWRRCFPADRLYVLFLEDMRERLQDAMDGVFAHLDLSPFSVDPSDMLHRRNYEPMPVEARNWLEEYFREPNRRLAELLGRDLPAGWVC